MKKRKPILFLFLIVFIASCQRQQIETERPNIIIIMTDDQGYGDFGINGNDIIETPTINKLAAESVRFDRFYVSPGMLRS